MLLLLLSFLVISLLYILSISFSLCNENINVFFYVEDPFYCFLSVCKLDCHGLNLLVTGLFLSCVDLSLASCSRFICSLFMRLVYLVDFLLLISNVFIISYIPKSK